MARHRRELLHHFRLRLALAFGLLGLVFLVVIGRLFYLQIIRGAYYRERSRRLILSHERIRSHRGTLLSREGLPLAQDRPSFDLALLLGRIRGARRIVRRLRRALAPPRWMVRRYVRTGPPAVKFLANGETAVTFRYRALFIDPYHRNQDVKQAGERAFRLPAEYRQAVRPAVERLGLSFRGAMEGVGGHFIAIARGRESLNSPCILRQALPLKLAMEVEVRNEAYPHFVVIPSARRAYPRGRLAAHTIGRMAKLLPQEYESHKASYAGSERKRYRMNEIIGRQGLEKQYNVELRGLWGEEILERDAGHHRYSTLDLVRPVPGADVQLTLHASLQRLVEDAFSRSVGACVILDPSNGDVLALLSRPGYDPNHFSADYPKLRSDPERPLFHRAISGAYPPGSVFKLVTALAALRYGLDPETTYLHCSGSLRVGRRSFGCHSAHGSSNLRRAIQRSCNCFFYQAGLRYAGGRGILEVASWLRLGHPTGIDLPAEKVPPLPELVGTGDPVNWSIGQGAIQVTPLQMAQVVGAIATGGAIYRPRLLKRVVWPGRAGPGAAPRPQRTVQLRIPPAHLKAIQAGMYRVVNAPGGTARRAWRGWRRSFKVAGKTGTAQRTTARGVDNVGWFVGYAPFDAPRLVFVVVVERLTTREAGGGTAAPIARRILEAMPEDLLRTPAAASPIARAGTD